MERTEYAADDTRGYGVTSLGATLLAIAVTGRGDVKVDVTPGIPAVGALPVQVQNNQVTVFGSVFAPLGAARYVPLDQYVTRYQMPALAGSVIAGAVWATKPPLPPAAAGWDPEVREAAELLGRVRAEARHIQRRTTDWVLLSAALPRVVAALLAGGVGAAVERKVLSTLLGGVLVRVASGVLPSGLAARCLEVVGQRLPADTFGQVAAVCADLGAVPDGHHDELEALSHRWVEMIHRLLPQLPPSPSTDGGGDDSGSDTSSEADNDQGADRDTPGDAGGLVEDEGAGSAREAHGEGDDADDGHDADGVGPGCHGDEGVRGQNPWEGPRSGEPSEPRHTPTDDDAIGFYPSDGDPWDINDPNPDTGDWPDLDTPCALADAITGLLDHAAAEAGAAAEQRHAGLTAPADPAQGFAAAAHKAGQGVFLGATTYNARPVVRFKAPTTNDHRAAAELLTQLRKARYIAPSRTHVRTTTPPRKTRTTGLLQRAAQIAQGEAVTAKPWATELVRSNPHPPLTEALVMDCSGSMDAWRNYVGLTAWMTAKATRKLGGDTAAVMFADTVEPLLAPKASLQMIPIPALTGGSNGCAEAMEAADGILHLAARPGARVMTVLTDGGIGGQPKIQRVTDYLVKRGVVVVWADINPTPGWAPKLVLHVHGFTPATFPRIVGQACADALTAAAGATRI